MELTVCLCMLKTLELAGAFPVEADYFSEAAFAHTALSTCNMTERFQFVYLPQQAALTMGRGEVLSHCQECGTGVPLILHQDKV